MSQRFLQVTYEEGRPLAAYLYLPRAAGARSERVERVDRGILIDYAESGLPIGVEITAPSAASLVAINSVLDRLGQAPLTESEWRRVAA